MSLYNTINAIASSWLLWPLYNQINIAPVPLLTWLTWLTDYYWGLLNRIWSFLSQLYSASLFISENIIKIAGSFPSNLTDVHINLDNGLIIASISSIFFNRPSADSVLMLKFLILFLHPRISLDIYSMTKAYNISWEREVQSNEILINSRGSENMVQSYSVLIVILASYVIAIEIEILFLWLLQQI